MYILVDDELYYIYLRELKDEEIPHRISLHLQHHLLKERKVNKIITLEQDSEHYPFYFMLFHFEAPIPSIKSMTISEETSLINDLEDNQERKIDEIHFHCPLTLTTPSGNSNDLIITRLNWSLHHYWKNHSASYRKTRINSSLSNKGKDLLVCSSICCQCPLHTKPELHLTPDDLHSLGENYYKQQVQEHILDKPNYQI